MIALHVGFYKDPLKRGAAQLFDAWPTLTHVAEAVRSAGIEMVVLQAAHRDEVVQHNGPTCHFVRGWRHLAERAVSLRPDIVHVRGLSFAVQTRRLSRALPRVPFVVQDHADAPPGLLRSALQKWGLRGVAVITSAREQMQPFLDAKILSPDTRIFEAFEATTRFQPGDQADADEKTGLSGDPCLLWVGRLDENKDPLTVLDAVSRAAQQLPGLRLWCCYTDAPLLDDVKEKIRSDPALAGRVHLLGRVRHKDVEQLMRAADFLVLASRREGSCFAVIEALACGATPLVTDIPTLSRMTGHGAVGALFTPGDAAALARIIIEFSARNREELRRKAREHFEQHLSFDALGRDLRRVYDELVTAQ